jgi:hypothetical protein
MQQDLPFHEGEAAHRERRNTLNLALAKVGCDLHLREFVMLVFNLTSGGVSGFLKRSYTELTYRPNGLCCALARARRTVFQAISLGFVACHRGRYCTGTHGPNSYRIDWDGIRAILGLTSAHSEQGLAHSEQGLAHSEQGPAQGAHLDQNRGAHANGLPTRAPASDPPLSPLLNSGAGAGDRAVADKWILEIPELAAAVGRQVHPLPPKSLAYGVFTPIQVEYLGKPLIMLEWHRRQLATARPVCGATEAHVLLSLAAAIYSRDMPHEQVRKNRVALFVRTVRNIERQRYDVFAHVPKARASLDMMLETFGDALLDGEHWPPARLAGLKAGALPAEPTTDH